MRKWQALLRNSGQATLELSVALILVVILLVACVRIFAWLNERLLDRQVQYENSRVAAASQGFGTVTVSRGDFSSDSDLSIGEVGIDESGFEDLNLVVEFN